MNNFGEKKLIKPKNIWDFSIYEDLHELDILARTIYAESLSEPYIGKLAVAYVIHNRTKTNLKEFGGNNLKDVLLFKNSFEGLTSPFAREPNIETPEWKDSLEIALGYKKRTNPIGNCLWFMKKSLFIESSYQENNQIFLKLSKTNKWRKISFKKTIKNHTFYLFEGY